MLYDISVFPMIYQLFIVYDNNIIYIIFFLNFSINYYLSYNCDIFIQKNINISVSNYKKKSYNIISCSSVIKIKNSNIYDYITKGSLNDTAALSEAIAANYIKKKLCSNKIPFIIWNETSILYKGGLDIVKGMFDFIISFNHNKKYYNVGVQVVRSMTHPTHFFNGNTSKKINNNKLIIKQKEICNGKDKFLTVKNKGFHIGNTQKMKTSIKKITNTMIIVIQQGLNCINKKTYPKTDDNFISLMRNNMNKILTNNFTNNSGTKIIFIKTHMGSVFIDNSK